MSDGEVWAVETETEVGLPDQIQHSQLNLGFILMSNFWLEYFSNMEWDIPILKKLSIYLKFRFNRVSCIFIC